MLRTKSSWLIHQTSHEKIFRIWQEQGILERGGIEVWSRSLKLWLPGYSIIGLFAGRLLPGMQYPSGKALPAGLKHRQQSGLWSR